MHVDFQLIADTGILIQLTRMPACGLQALPKQRPAVVVAASLRNRPKCNQPSFVGT